MERRERGGEKRGSRSHTPLGAFGSRHWTVTSFLTSGTWLGYLTIPLALQNSIGGVWMGSAGQRAQTAVEGREGVQRMGTGMWMGALLGARKVR